LRRVLSLHLEAYTLLSSMVADDFSRMAAIDGEQKKIASAISSLDAALDIRTKLGGPLDPTLIPDLDRLGEYHTMMRAYDQAEAAFRHGLVIRETLYGKTHADLITTVDGLAYALFGQKKYNEAEPVYLRLIGLWESSVGKDHAMVAVALDKLAVFYAAQKKYPEVRDALERSAAIRSRFLALGISQQATQAFTEGQTDHVKAFYRRGLAVLDPPNPINEDLRGQFEDLLKSLDAPPPKSGAAPKRVPTPPKKKDKL
jgi:tetratricopeptide (TPR) repeat protein